jgi:outer membrane protein assembly factor BamB
VFVASCSGSLFGLERKTGAFVWTYDARQDGGKPEFHGASIVTDDTIVVASDDRRAGGLGHLYAIDRGTGKPRWKRPFDVGVMTDLALVEDVLYFATLREQVVAVRISSGEPVWTFAAGSAGERFFATSSPVVSETRVFFGGVDGTIHALDRKTGESVWARSLGARVSTSLVDVDRNLLVGTADNRLHLLGPDDGKTIASRELPGLPFGRPIRAAGGIVVFTTGGVALSTSSDLGSVRWETKVDTEWASFRPLLLGTEILAGADDGHVHAIAAKDGAKLWSQDFGGPVTSLTVAGDGECYVGTTRGIVFATHSTPQEKSRSDRPVAPDERGSRPDLAHPPPDRGSSGDVASRGGAARRAGAGSITPRRRHVRHVLG